MGFFDNRTTSGYMSRNYPVSMIEAILMGGAYLGVALLVIALARPEH